MQADWTPRQLIEQPHDNITELPCADANRPWLIHASSKAESCRPMCSSSTEPQEAQGGLERGVNLAALGAGSSPAQERHTHTAQRQNVPLFPNLTRHLTSTLLILSRFRPDPAT